MGIHRSRPVLAVVVRAAGSDERSPSAGEPCPGGMPPAPAGTGRPFRSPKPGVETLKVRGQGGGEKTKSSHVKAVLRVL